MNALPTEKDGRCVCEKCEGNFIQVDPIHCGCTECLIGLYRPAENEDDYNAHNIMGTQIIKNK